MLLVSGYLARFRRRYRAHKTIQLTVAMALLVALIAFEIEMRMFGWREQAAASPFWIAGAWNDWIDYSLAVHLLFAIPTPFVWGVVIIAALRNFPRPPAPGAHSHFHRRWGRLAMLWLLLTAVTGWGFYYTAFMAQ